MKNSFFVSKNGDKILFILERNGDYFVFGEFCVFFAKIFGKFYFGFWQMVFYMAFLKKGACMTSVVLQAENRNDLKLFVALAKRQGIVVKYVKLTPATSKNKTDVLDKICGKWKSDKSADEMIENIYSSRVSGKTRKLVECE